MEFWQSKEVSTEEQASLIRRITLNFKDTSVTFTSKHFINMRKIINQVIIMICLIIQPGKTLCCCCNEGSAESWSCGLAEKAASCCYSSLIHSPSLITPSWTRAPPGFAGLGKEILPCWIVWSYCYQVLSSGGDVESYPFSTLYNIPVLSNISVLSV